MHLQLALPASQTDYMQHLTAPESRGLLCLNATEVSDWKTVSNLSQSDSEHLLPFFGLHPRFISKSDSGKTLCRDLTAQLDRTPISGIGEIGLDKRRKSPDLALQKTFFDKQLSIAFDSKRTASIHCVRAWGDLVKCLKRYGNWDGRILIHAFNGSLEIQQELLKLNAHFSYGCSIAKTSNKRQRKALQNTPLDNLHLETDSPEMFCSDILTYGNWQPTPMETEQQTAPSTIKRVYACAADILELEERNLMKKLQANFQHLTGHRIAGNSYTPK